jgi:hypothetical protein
MESGLVAREDFTRSVYTDAERYVIGAPHSLKAKYGAILAKGHLKHLARSSRKSLFPVSDGARRTRRALMPPTAIINVGFSSTRSPRSTFNFGSVLRLAPELGIDDARPVPQFDSRSAPQGKQRNHQTG